MIWEGKRVFLTGHTGFKGSWMCLWLSKLGAHTTGYSLRPPTEPSLFDQARVSELVTDVEGDVRDLDRLTHAMREASPDVVIHMAAQSLVRPSYDDPIGTYATNVMGTAHVLEAARRVQSARTIVIVTSDKCYENHEWHWPYRENDPMGGHDPYSSSKGCAELVTSAYARSFLSDRNVSTVRAGNVIGGGDWALDRLVPDAVRAFSRGEKVVLRNPTAIRPWQHVLEPLRAYLEIAARGARGAWNIGPDPSSVWPVARVVDELARHWDGGWVQDTRSHPHEAHALALDASKARNLLGWRPKLAIEPAIEWTARWYRRVAAGEDARTVTLEDIRRYEGLS